LVAGRLTFCAWQDSRASRPLTVEVGAVTTVQGEGFPMVDRRWGVE